MPLVTHNTHYQSLHDSKSSITSRTKPKKKTYPLMKGFNHRFFTVNNRINGNEVNASWDAPPKIPEPECSVNYTLNIILISNGISRRGSSFKFNYEIYV